MERVELKVVTWINMPNNRGKLVTLRTEYCKCDNFEQIKTSCKELKEDFKLLNPDFKHVEVNFIVRGSY